jgi:hypothetical protein
MPGLIRCIALLALTALCAGAPALAQEREARLLRGPMTERPIAVACTPVQEGTCKNNAMAACANLCNPTQTPNALQCVRCEQQHLDACMAQCK